MDPSQIALTQAADFLTPTGGFDRMPTAGQSPMTVRTADTRLSIASGFQPGRCASGISGLSRSHWSSLRSVSYAGRVI
jgi:hypothetical protein